MLALSPSLVLCLSLAASGLDAKPQQKTWWLVMQAEQQWKAVRANGRETRTLPTPTWDWTFTLSPDQTKAASGPSMVSLDKDGHEASRSSWIYLQDVTTGKRTDIMATMETDPKWYLTWSLDSRCLAYYSGPGLGPWQLRELDTVDLKLHTVFSSITPLRQIGYTAGRNIAFLRPAGVAAAAGAELMDLVVLEKPQPKVLVAGQPIIHFAFSPDGRTLAYTVRGELILHTLTTGIERRIRMSAINSDWPVTFITPLWRPDSQAVVCTLAAWAGWKDEEVQKYPFRQQPGLGQMVLVPLEDAPVVLEGGFHLEKGHQAFFTPCYWCEAKELPVPAKAP